MFTAFLGEIDFIKYVVNDDFTITFTMTKSQQKEFLNFLSDSFKSSITDEMPKYYEKIVANDDFTLFKVYVNEIKYNENSKTDMRNLSLLMWGM